MAEKDKGTANKVANWNFLNTQESPWALVPLPLRPILNRCNQWPTTKSTLARIGGPLQRTRLRQLFGCRVCYTEFNNHIKIMLNEW